MINMYGRMMLLPILGCWLLLPNSVTSIKCYECYTVTHPFYTDDYITKRLCKNFDYSEDFIIDCGKSTYCRKTIMKEVILQELVETERGCANQLYVGLTQKNGAWNNEQRVVDNVYKQECIHVESYGLRDAKIENCYCKTDLCNSGAIFYYSLGCLVVSVVVFVKNLFIL